MKILSRTVLTYYLLVLLWLLLFKFSSHPLSVLSSYQTRSLNLIPFANTTLSNLHQIVYNIIALVPLGLLLGVNLKETKFWRKLIYIFALSVAVEITQYIFAIGRSDITDVIANTVGGLIGLLLYASVMKHVESEKLDRIIVVVVAVLLIMFTLLRTLVFRFKYHSH